jgi:hypothetical protein
VRNAGLALIPNCNCGRNLARICTHALLAAFAPGRTLVAPFYRPLNPHAALRRTL